MDRTEAILEAVFRAIDEVNLQRDPDEQLGKSEDTLLVAEDGGLDSLGLISLLVAVEEEVESEHHVSLGLTEDLLALQGGDGSEPGQSSHLENVGALVRHISGLIEVKANG